MSNNDDYKRLPGLFAKGDIRDPYIKHIGGISGSATEPAKFSFKPISASSDKHKINVFPRELETFLINDDSWNSSLKDFSVFLNQIPQIQIRAYAPDTILQFAQGILETAIAGGKKGAELAKKGGFNALFSAIGSEIGATTESVMAFFDGLFFNGKSAEVFYDTFKKELKENKAIKDRQIHKSYDISILDIPYILYFKILGSTTNAIYEVPCQFPNNILNSNGSYGWENSQSISRILSPKQSTTKKTTSNSENESNNDSKFLASTFTTLGGFLANKLNLTVAPVFRPNNDKSENIEFSIGFDLINDTFDHAKENFEFIQTLIANNKWVQTLIFSNPANLYDVKIPGGHRLFMCTGNFTVSYKGAIRKAPETQSFGVFLNETRIPEAYSVKLTFKSLIPDNFNTYMLGLLKSNENLFKYVNGNRHEDGFVTDINNAFSKAMKASINSISSNSISSTQFDKIFHEYMIGELSREIVKNIITGDKYKTANFEEIKQNLNEDQIALVSKMEEDSQIIISVHFEKSLYEFFKDPFNKGKNPTQEEIAKWRLEGRDEAYREMEKRYKDDENYRQLLKAVHSSLEYRNTQTSLMLIR